MRARLAVVAVVFGVAACGGGDDDPGDDTSLPTGPIAARIDHYEYRFDVDSRAATSILTATVETAGDCLSLPYRAGELDIAATKLDGVVARSATVDAEVVTICGAGYDAGHELTIEAAMDIPMTTLGSSDVGYSITPDRWDNPMYYLVSWLGGCDRFGPCDHRPDRFATYTFVVTHPAELVVNCPGVITHPDPTTTRCDFTLPGGPTYSTFGVIGSTNYVVDEFDFNGQAVALYDHAGSGVAARIDAAYHGGFLDFMRDHFGPFPYGDELRIITGPTYWAGFEHPGNIVLDDGLGTPPSPSGIHYTDPLAHILNHEMAHQWAGDQTTLADTYDFVWKEAMAEYLSYVYEADTDPDWAADTREYWKAAANGAQFFPVPLDEPRPALVTYYGDVYGPGPLILFLQIERLSSRAAVLTALEAVLGEPSTLSVDEVQVALEAATGLDLDAYFAAWVRGTGAPAWPRIAADFDDATATLTIAQANVAQGERGCAFEVELRGAVAGETQRVPIDTFTNGPEQTITVVPAPVFDVATIQIDPDDYCLVFAAPSSLARSPALPRVYPWVSERAQPSK
jgi:aminopeptidase N